MVCCGVWCVVECGVVRCGVVRCGGLRCGVVWRGRSYCPSGAVNGFGVVGVNARRNGEMLYRRRPQIVHY